MKKKNLIIAAGIVAGAATATGIIAARSRRSIPKGEHAVEHFNSKKFLGKWYEIARLPMRFEKGMSGITAHFGLTNDGVIDVIYKGYHPHKRKWNEVRGKAKYRNSSDVGALKVSFFRPFYSGYNVVGIDKGYDNALVFGRNHKYMWLLSRKKQMPEKTKAAFLERARNAGYDISRLIWTKQNRSTF